MRLKGLFAVLCTLALVGPLHAEDGRFLSVIDDLPLMAGLDEAGDGVQFATPQGRIAEVTARGRVSRAQVLKFYADTLPQLGWSRTGDGRFAREGETLALVFDESGGALSVRFSVTPGAQ